MRSYVQRTSFILAAALIAAGGWTVARPQAQAPAAASVKPTNDLPNPYQTLTGWVKLPDNRTWGSTSAVDIDKDGKTIWVAERCGQNSCFQNTTIAPILHIDQNGTVLKAFGAGEIVSPHGFYVDRDNNIWVTDYEDNAPRTPRPAVTPTAAPAPAPAGPPPVPQVPSQLPRPGATKGHVVLKFSPEGKLLMTVGKQGGGFEPEGLYQPNDVITAPNGDIFIAQGHGVPVDKILKFDKTGKFIKSFGKRGTGPGEFDQPHALAFDSQGRLFVGDRNNNRVQIFDQDGKYLAETQAFSRPSGVFIDKNDVLYVADSESGSVSRNHDGWKRGIRIGSAKDLTPKYFIPDPEARNRPDGFSGTSAAEGVAADAAGNIYGAEVGPKDLKKYVKK